MDDDQEGWTAYMAHWAESKILERTVPQLLALALDENGPGCPVDLDRGTDHSQGTRIGGELAKLMGQRFGEYVLKKRRSSAVRTWYLDPVNTPTE
jgi:hypothetical protein